MLCQYCGKPMTGHKRKYCDKQCRDSVPRKPAVRKQIDYICQICSKPFKSIQYNRKVCSDKCKGIIRRKRYAVCKWCGERYWLKGTGRDTFCSRECSYESLSYYGKINSFWRKVKDHSDRASVCSYCGSTYTMFYGNKYCCDNCRCLSLRKIYRVASKKRWEIMNNECSDKIDRNSVFIEADWICQICGIVTDPLQCKTHHSRPELDHIIPLSRGGSHVLSNVQCLCLRCNRSKKDKIIG